LGDVWTSGLAFDGARDIMDNWIVAGLLAVTSITTTMGAYGTMVEDKAEKINKDFIASALKQSSIVGGYILSAYVIGFIMSILALILGEIYVIANGGTAIPFITLLEVIGIMLLSTLAGSSLILFLVSFFSSNNAFATASAIIGTIIGFLTGIYLPIGQLPDGMQWVVKLFPVSHSAVLLRQKLMAAPIAKHLANAPPEVIDELSAELGMTFHFGDYILPEYASYLILAGTALLFFGLSVLVLSRKKNK
ncbi:MAG TPA: ABC transporter permease, partial [Clostridia bacterium]|nr:ABC transporter permease [Clostridia bacterium]